MNKRILTTLIILTSVFSSANIPADASQPTPINQQSIQQESRTPQQAMIVYLLTDLVLNAGKKDLRPITLGLGQDLTDSEGNIIAPKNSPVSAKIKFMGKGVQIIVDGIVTNKSQLIPIQASTELIPGDRVTTKSGAEKAQQYGSVGARVGSMTLGVIGNGDTDSTFGGAIAGGLVGTVIGLSSSEEKHEVKIPQGSLYVLTLQTSPRQPSVTLSQPTRKLETTAKVSTKFNFQNIAQYSKQLKRIVQDYQKGTISKEEARNTIEAANQYATTKLRRKLYPPTVLREQVSQIFAFNYPIDRKEK